MALLRRGLMLLLPTSCCLHGGPGSQSHLPDFSHHPRVIPRRLLFLLYFLFLLSGTSPHPSPYSRCGWFPFILWVSFNVASSGAFPGRSHFGRPPYRSFSVFVSFRVLITIYNVIQTISLEIKISKTSPCLCLTLPAPVPGNCPR